MVIKNQKSILTGEDTHAATLTGSIIINSPSNYYPPRSGSQNRSGPNVVQISNRSGVVTSSPNAIFGRFIQGINGVGGTVTYTARVRRDNATSGVIVANGFRGSESNEFTFDLFFTDENVSVGAHTYFFSVEITQTTTQAPVPFDIYPASNSVIVPVRSSFAATLTGANTQDTRDQGIIQG